MPLHCRVPRRTDLGDGQCGRGGHRFLYPARRELTWMTDTEPTVFLVDDDLAVRKALSWLFKSVHLPVRTFASGQAFLDAYQAGQLGCILIDLRMPGMSGLELQTELSARQISLPVIMITGHGEVDAAVHAMKAGALDFIRKPFSDQTLLEVVQKALKSDIETHRARNERNEIKRRLDRLTPRERQVLDRIMDGDPNKRIAVAIERSEKTVEAHRKKIMEKIEVRSVVELVRLVMAADPKP